MQWLPGDGTRMMNAVEYVVIPSRHAVPTAKYLAMTALQCGAHATMRSICIVSSSGSSLSRMCGRYVRCAAESGLFEVTLRI